MSRILLSRLGIQVWSLRRPNVPVSVVSMQIIGAGLSYLVFDDNSAELCHQPNTRLLIESMLKAIGYRLGEIAFFSAKDLPNITLLIAMGTHATSLAMTHYAGVNNLITIPYSPLAILANPIRKKQVWMEMLNPLLSVLN